MTHAPVVPSTKPKPSRRVPYTVAALAAVVGGLALILFFGHDDETRPARPRSPDEVPALERAKALRNEAAITCQLQLWVRCGQKLDEATKLDPAGESDPRVQALRAVVKEETSRPKPDRPDK
jgi:hypothetical protein